MGARCGGAPFCDGCHECHARRIDPRGSRRLSAHTDEAGLPEALPRPGSVPDRTLATGRRRRLSHGPCPRPLLPWLLLVPDGALVLRRNRERFVDRGSVDLCFVREDGAGRSLARAGGGSAPRRRGSARAFRRVITMWMEKAMATDWYIAATTFGNCTCDYNCPCQFELRPTHGYCRGFEIGRIERGHFGAVQLDGLYYAVTYA